MSTPDAPDEIDLYLEQELDEAAKRAFEVRMLEDPDLAEEVLRRQDVRDELRRQLADAPKLELVTGGATRAPRTRQWSLDAGSFGAGLAAAAMLVVAVGVLPSDSSGPGAITITDDVYLARVRGELPSVPAGVRFLLTIEPSDNAERYDVTLHNEQGESVFSVTGASKTADQLVMLVVDPLDEGLYKANVTAPGAEPEVFELSVRER